MKVYMNLDYILSKPISEYKKATLAQMPNNSHFITITLNPVMYKMSISDQFNISSKYIKLKIKQWSRNFWLVAELTNNSNIHYHGYIYFEQERYKHALIDDLKYSMTTGMNKINDCVIVDKERTINYMYKDFDVTRRYISIPIIKYKYRKPRSELELEWGTEGAQGAEGPHTPLAGVNLGLDLDSEIIC